MYPDAPSFNACTAEFKVALPVIIIISMPGCFSFKGFKRSVPLISGSFKSNRAILKKFLVILLIASCPD